MKDGAKVTLSAPDDNKIKIKDQILRVDPSLRIDGDHSLKVTASSGIYSAFLEVTILSPPLPEQVELNFPPIVEGETTIMIGQNLTFKFPVID